MEGLTRLGFVEPERRHLKSLKYLSVGDTESEPKKTIQFLVNSE